MPVVVHVLGLFYFALLDSGERRERPAQAHRTTGPCLATQRENSTLAFYTAGFI